MGKKKNDLGLRVEKEEVAAWEKIRMAAEEDLKNAKRGIIIQEKILELADTMILKEKEEKQNI